MCITYRSAKSILANMIVQEQLEDKTLIKAAGWIYNLPQQTPIFHHEP